MLKPLANQLPSKDIEEYFEASPISPREWDEAALNFYYPEYPTSTTAQPSQVDKNCIDTWIRPKIIEGIFLIFIYMMLAGISATSFSYANINYKIFYGALAALWSVLLRNEISKTAEEFKHNVKQIQIAYAAWDDPCCSPPLRKINNSSGCAPIFVDKKTKIHTLFRIKEGLYVTVLPNTTRKRREIIYSISDNGEIQTGWIDKKYLKRISGKTMHKLTGKAR